MVSNRPSLFDWFQAHGSGEEFFDSDNDFISSDDLDLNLDLDPDLRKGQSSKSSASFRKFFEKSNFNPFSENTSYQGSWVKVVATRRSKDKFYVSRFLERLLNDFLF